MNPSPAPRRLGKLLRNRDGVALSVSLFGLIAVTIMITAVILTSSTELALSGAHQDATRTLYMAEEGLERFAVDANLDRTLLQPGTITRPGNPYNTTITIAELSRFTTQDTTATTYSVSAAPLLPGGRAGRTVMAMISVVETVSVVPGLTLNAAATFAGNVRMDGSVVLAGTQSKSLCALDTVKKSMTSLEGSTVTGANSSRLPNGQERLAMTTQELRQRVMGDLTFQNLYDRADIKFPWGGKRLGEKVEFKNYGIEKSESKAPVATWVPVNPSAPAVKLGSHWLNPYKPAESHPYNWGCPYTTLGNTGCDWQWADTTFYPVIGVDAWDAVNQRNGVVRLDGAHGQGLLVIMRSNLIIGSTFFFKGIILVEGELDINSSATIHGAIVGFNETDVWNDNEQQDMNGTITVRYDQCVIDKINLGFGPGDDTGLQTVISRPFGWTEVVR